MRSPKELLLLIILFKNSIIRRMNWPSNSPDLNSIEYVLHVLIISSLQNIIIFKILELNDLDFIHTVN